MDIPKLPSNRKSQGKKTAKKKKTKNVRKPDGHIIPTLASDQSQQPKYGVAEVVGMVLDVRENMNFCLVKVRGNASLVACTIPPSYGEMKHMVGKLIKMEEYTRDGKKYYRHISLSGTSLWHGVNPTKG